MLSKKAREAKNAYMRDWKRRNRDKCNAYYRKWRRANPDKIRQYNEQYWGRKYEQMAGIMDNERTVTDTVTDTVTSVTSVTITCLNCGRSFEKQRATAKYCSDHCRVSYNRKNKKADYVH